MEAEEIRDRIRREMRRVEESIWFREVYEGKSLGETTRLRVRPEAGGEEGEADG